METQIWSSELANCSNYNCTEKAWHLVSVLLSLGKPVSPHELAAKCSLFRTTPDFIVFLCSIPNSPLNLIANKFVGLSMSVLRSFGEFFASSMPKIELRGGERILRCSDMTRTYFRKRKKLDNEMMLVVKKRAVLRSIDENVPVMESSGVTPTLVSGCFEGVDLQSAYPSTSSNAIPFNRFPQSINPLIISDMVATPSMVNSSVRLLEHQLNIDNQENGYGQNTSVVNDTNKCEAMVERMDISYAKELLLDLLHYNPDVSEASLREKVAEFSAVMHGTDHELTNRECRTTDVPFCVELNQHDKNSPVKPTASIDAAKDIRHSPTRVTKILDLNEQPLIDDDGPEGRIENITFGSGTGVLSSVDLQQTNMEIIVRDATLKEEPTNIKSTSLPLVSDGPEGRIENITFGSCTGVLPSVDLQQTNMEIISTASTLKEEPTNIKSTSLPLVSDGPQFSAQKPDTKSLVLKNVSQDGLTQQQTPSKLMRHNKVDNITFGSGTGVLSSVDLQQTNKEIIGKASTLNEEPTNIKSTSLPLVSDGPQLSVQKSDTKSLVLKNVSQDGRTQKQQTLSKLMRHNKVDNIHKERKGQGQNHRMIMAMMDKPKSIAKNDAPIQKTCDDVHKSAKDKHKSKFPEFELYTVEEEEGSGGYGTVYRARRNADGLKFAVKCPHENAHKQHLKNELKMLERFGGKNYVIKYEGSIKSESSDCFVLEHVEHDRPEVLKKEIDILQLQLYGYCMFRALVSLHKQGVFHRDIKPGNFLFSRKTRKGYLIDFNLAKDMNQKHGNIEKSQPSSVTAAQQIPSPHFKSTSLNKQKKILDGKSFEPLKAGATNGSNRALETNVAPKKKDLEKLKAYVDIGRCNSLTSQGADGSGVTSTRDMTSTRAPSAERLRKPQPLFCKGRKELISLARKAMESPNLGGARAPASNRKRVAASPGTTDRNVIYPSPTPFHSFGVAISGAGSLKNRGEVKPVNKDGPSAGTKGFRAPEVLLRSLHQGPKVDVWSAGVTLLYLLSGRMPFNGDPEQNMKEIVNMKGNEELWEVAKLHNRESSFPVELLDVRYIQSMTVKDWYKTNTKRQDLLEVIPDSLFDLLEKCLSVNPRLRITAEEALNHEFFARVSGHKKRLLRQDPSQDSKSNSLLPLLCEPVKPSKENLITPVNL
ncbi:hypothetical protein SOVF_119640 [Spinacia oleracea]|nr:hypothetical protein SOVF_119640 [Spinacia oleracea]